MDRESLLAQIWNEKREKILSDVVYPLGIGIFLGSPCFNWHELVYGLIKFLRSDPARAFVWSQNWGRTNVVLGRFHFPQFAFLTRNSDEEKALIPISTEKLLDPVSLLTPEFNRGCFKLLINHQFLSVEGAVLQIERMVDEMVWCAFLKLKEEMRVLGCDLEPGAVYARALDLVWQGGVTINYVSEEYILRLKESNPLLPVRVYGDKNKKQIVPHVIGAVILPAETKAFSGDNYLIQELINQVFNGNNFSIAIKPFFSAPVLPFAELFVCAGITMGKLPHIGHLFLLAYADMIRMAMCPTTPLYVESNDTGPRVAGMIAKMIETHQMPIFSALNLLHEGHYSVSDIENWYINRTCPSKIVDDIGRILDIGGYDVFSVLRRSFLDAIHRYGFCNVVVVSDSECRAELENFFIDIPWSPWRDYGFYFTQHQKGNHIKTILYRSFGMTTSSAARLSFVKKVLFRESGKTAIYVDIDQSIANATTALIDIEKQPVFQYQGTAVGFGLIIASGSESNTVPMEKLYEAFLDVQSRIKTISSFIHVVKYFLLTRYETAKSKKTYQHRSEIIGPTFYDFKNHEALILDFNRCIGEYETFLTSLEQSENKLFKMSEVAEKTPFCEYERFLRGALRVINEGKLGELFPRVQQIIPDLFFRQAYNQLQFHGVFNLGEQFNVSVVDGLVSGAKLLGSLSDFLIERGLLNSPVKKNRDKVVNCLYIDNLFSRGYTPDDIRLLAPQYLRGEFALTRRRCLFFDILTSSVRIIKEIDSMPQISAMSLHKVIKTCKEKLGMCISY